MKVVFMGTPAAAVPCLKRLVDDGHDVVAVYCQPDRPSGRGQKLTAPPVKLVAEELGIAVKQPEKVKTSEAAEEFRLLGADVAVVVAYGRILPPNFLNAFKYGAVNIHFSLLPKYRGAAPVNWAVVNGDRETGVCSMKMDQGLDTGDLLLVKSVPIEFGENALHLMERLADVGAEVLSETLAQIDTLVPMPQDDSGATYAPILKKSDGVIDWNLDAESICNRIRGFQPFPTSFTFLNEKKITLWNAEVTGCEITASTTGEIVEACGGQLVISCGDSSWLRVREIQIEGKRRMDVRDFLNGNHLAVGDILRRS
jgi:methionyl-tRNA formyltransferase